ncbi:type VI secretion system-associated protein VasI [Vibrio zhugei]|uniref:Type VI secretion system-associated protein VasI n=1 Tax=Vibrio zhugei TaxID=2479546 RepID=A0ABV7CAJ6_9VIBR|nr:type VI secretion system-associated protein VasI [Vibrio zhugei]
MSVTLCPILLSTCVLSAFSVSAAPKDTRLKQAQQCSKITGRLERLDCFDKVFNTPINIEQSQGQAYPSAWQRAMKAAHDAGNEQRALVTQGEGRGSSAWIAFTATNASTQFAGNAKPVLLMSCMHNLSRVEIALPKPVKDGRIRIAVAGGQEQYWRSDDVGVLMSSARGLPAIRMMKAMTQGPSLTLRSNASFVDGLRFNTRDVATQLSALRDRCGW